MTREEAWRRTKGYLYDALSGEEADEIIKTLELSRDMEEIEEVINCDADTETKCKMIYNILTAKPHYFEKQEPTGHWIIMGDRYIKCSECGHVTKTESPDIYNFCMVCGTKMSENPTYPESEE
jgi:DNA-directed RNA polymerase subunit RPC12/RpoP